MSDTITEKEVVVSEHVSLSEIINKQSGLDLNFKCIEEELSHIWVLSLAPDMGWPAQPSCQQQSRAGTGWPAASSCRERRQVGWPRPAPAHTAPTFHVRGKFNTHSWLISRTKYCHQKCDYLSNIENLNLSLSGHGQLWISSNLKGKKSWIKFCFGPDITHYYYTTLSAPAFCLCPTPRLTMSYCWTKSLPPFV